MNCWNDWNVLELASFLRLGVTDVRFDALDQFRRHLANAVFLGVLSRFLHYFFYGLTSDDVLTPARRVYLGAFQHLCHGLASLVFMGCSL